MDIKSLRNVGKSDLAITPLGFGGGTIGSPEVSNEASLETVAAAWACGVRYYDTAPWYGIGRSERRLGLALSGIAERAEYRINTKVGKTLLPEPVRDEANKTLSPGGQVRTVRDSLSGFRVDFNYSHDRIMAQHHDSLQRLGLSSVDSLTIHDIDYGYHSQEQLERHLDELSRDGGGAPRHWKIFGKPALSRLSAVVVTLNRAMPIAGWAVNTRSSVNALRILSIWISSSSPVPIRCSRHGR